MGIKMKMWLIIALILLCVGLVVFTVAMTLVGWDFGKFSGERETAAHAIEEDFGDISLCTDSAEIKILPSEDGTTKVVCEERSKNKHAVSVIDGVLTVEREDHRKWYHHILDFGTQKITLYLPKSEYGKLLVKESTGNIDIAESFTFESIDISVSTADVDCKASALHALSVKTSTGDIRLKGNAAQELFLSVSTGKISLSSVTVQEDITLNVSTGKAFLENVTCANLFSDGDTGDITLKSVIASGKFVIERSTGDVTFDSADAAELFIETDTGNVKGTLRTDKIFFVDTDTGRVDVPHLTAGGKCEIETDTGSVKIEIK